MFGPLNRAISQVVEYLQHHWPLVLLSAVTAILAYAATAWVVRFLIPALVRGIVLPLIAAVTYTAAVVLLALQALAALPFRAVRMRPLIVVYGCGDAIMWATAGITGGLRNMAGSIDRRRRVGGRFVVLLMVAAALGWYYGSCDHDPDSDSCRRPVSTATGAVQDMWLAIGRTVSI